MSTHKRLLYQKFYFPEKKNIHYSELGFNALNYIVNYYGYDWNKLKEDSKENQIIDTFIIYITDISNFFDKLYLNNKALKKSLDLLKMYFR